MRTSQTTLLLAFQSIGLLSCSSHVTAAFTEFKQNKMGWQSAVNNNFTTLDFNFGQQVVVTDQYAALGALFTDGQELTSYGPSAFPNDSWGLRGSFPLSPGPITVHFAKPMNWIAVDHPGNVYLKLYSDEELVFTSSWSGFPPPSPFFFGVVSDVAFNKVEIHDPFDAIVFIDDLYFGAPIPAPGAIALLAITGVCRGRRRRTGRAQSRRRSNSSR